MRSHEVVLAEAKKDVGFAHPAVANYQQLGQVVVVLIPAHVKYKIIEIIS